MKYNVSTFTLCLLAILAIQINLLYFLGMMPEQVIPADEAMSFAGSTLPNIIEMIQSLFSF